MYLIFLILAELFSFKASAIEGFYPVSANSRHNHVQDAVVKISIPKKMNFASENYENPYIDDSGSIVESWGLGGGPWRPTINNCQNRNYSSFNYFEDACRHISAGGNLEQPLSVKFSGTGYFSHSSGKIVTAKHLVRGCELYYRGDLPFYCPIIETEVVKDGIKQTIKGADILAWSSNEGGDAMLDYALIDINFSARSTLPACPASPAIGTAVEVFGFPITSNRRTNERYRNADGTLRVSRGQLLNPNSQSMTDEPRTPDLINQDFLFTDADAVGGNSGGPVVSRDGCVVGTVTRALRQGDPMTSNINTEYTLSASNPTWISRLSGICNELNHSNMSHYVRGCEEQPLNLTSDSEQTSQ